MGDLKKGGEVECINNKYVENRLQVGVVYIVSDVTGQNVLLKDKSTQMFGVSRFKNITQKQKLKI